MIDRRIATVVACYDNEWGHACRIGDLAAYVSRRDAAVNVLPSELWRASNGSTSPRPEDLAIVVKR